MPYRKSNIIRRDNFDSPQINFAKIHGPAPKNAGENKKTCRLAGFLYKLKNIHLAFHTGQLGLPDIVRL